MPLEDSLPPQGVSCLRTVTRAKTLDKPEQSRYGSPMSIEYRGTIFSAYNTPKLTPNGPKKRAVLAKVGDKVKLEIGRAHV